MIKFLVAAVCLVSLSNGKDFPTLSHLRSKASPSEQTVAVTQLIQRVIGSRSSDFALKVDPSIGPPNRDTYILLSTGSKMSITGTSGVAVAMGFYNYLKYYCGGQFTWAGQQTKIPATLPQVPAPGVKVTSNDQFRYYQNVCTSSYTFAFWHWPRWEREVDWMALQGINLPLAFTGQEAIFQRVYMAMGFTMEDLNAHFGGPAFLAWARMGNIRGWGGPLPQTWLDAQLIMQHKILTRMRSLGMIPVLPGFAGHVPAATSKLFPNASVTRLGGWGNFNATYSQTYLLDFNDPLFAKIGGSFIKAMEDEFGVDHVYNADSFNEMKPKSNSTAYLASAAQGVYKGMLAGDPQAIWLMQGWLFLDHAFWKQPQIKALLTAIPIGKMIILDLNAELVPIYTSTQSFYGQPFIWCMLHNFGGTMELYGAMDRVNKGPFAGRVFPNSTMVGTGLTPEGIDQNEVMYELMNEMAWRPAPVDLAIWVDRFQTQRYGADNVYTSNAWSLLRSVFSCNDSHREHSTGVIITSRPSMGLNPDASVYNLTDGHQDFNNGYFTKRPSPSLGEDASVYNLTDGHQDFNNVYFTKRPFPFLGEDASVYNLNDGSYQFKDRYLTKRPHPFLRRDVWYKPEQLYQAWDNMVAASMGGFAYDNVLFKYDLVDITRNSLQIISLQYFHDMVNGYLTQNQTLLQSGGSKLLELLEDMETILASDDHFLLGNWIANAVQFSTDANETLLYNMNSRNQVTLWGPTGQIADYAAKQWSGLVGKYYKPRWQLFYDMLQECLVTGVPFSQQEYNEAVFKLVEAPFSASVAPFPTNTTGDSIMLASDIHKKYRPETRSNFFSHFTPTFQPYDIYNEGISWKSYRQPTNDQKKA